MLVREIQLRNFLSYSDEMESLALGQLNVLIGPNASGKSNLIEALGLLRATPGDLTKPIRDGGGVSEWLWKGRDPNPVATIEATIEYPAGEMPLRYRLGFTMTGQKLEVVDEAVENERSTYAGQDDVYFYYRYQGGKPTLNYKELDSSDRRPRSPRSLRREEIETDQSVLSQRKDPAQLPEITYLGQVFGQIKLFREWNWGRYTTPRLPQKADLPDDFLLEDASNLGLVLNSLQHSRNTKREIIGRLAEFYEGVEDITTRIHGGTVQIFLHEQGLAQPVPATRLSDGTLRYLSLLVVLCHPNPPSLICLEEPEIGLHPDIIPALAELLTLASTRTQLVVTTHSDILISALSETPEAVLVCERDAGGSRLRRLEAEHLRVWLEKYRLGELWRMGELGGTRW